MGDKHDAGAKILAQVSHQLEHLSLDRDIERCCRFVGDQHRWVADERHGDHGTLAHAAGKFMGILIHAGGGIGNADPIQHLDRQFAGFLFWISWCTMAASLIWSPRVWYEEKEVIGS